tara:strand:+ start:2226 stop:3119 length:894 start_codon:yes stop_codon:yes gene_type:complete
MRKIVFLFIIYYLEASPISPGLNSWFSASKLSYAGGGNLIFTPNSRATNPANFSSLRSFSTSFILYPSGIQAQSASVFLPKDSRFLIAAINHISYGAFYGYSQDAIPTDNYTSSETWLRFDYSSSLNELPIRYGVSNQFYFSKLEQYNSAKLYFSFGSIWELEKYKTSIGLSVDDFVLDISSNTKISQTSPLRYNIGLCKQLKYLPLKLSIDYLSIAANNKDYFISGIFSITKKLSLSWGTSTRKFSQNINEDIVKTIFGSSGLGISFMNDDIIVGYGLYFYGTGGLTNGIDLSIKF